MQSSKTHATHGANATREVLRQAEEPLIESRRKALGLDPIGQAPQVGLALSGGGIRSATFSLGLLQAIAAAGALRRIDYLSTVSGGGYAAVFLGALLRAPSRFARTQPATPPKAANAADAADPADATRLAGAAEAGYAFAERVLRGDEERTELLPPPSVEHPDRPLFHPVRWLRESGRYLTPTRGNDWPFAIAYYLRNLAALHVVGAAAAVSLSAAWVLAQVAVGLPLGTAGPVASPLWMAAAAAVLLFGAAGFAYWATSAPPTTRWQRLESWLVKASVPVLAIAGIGGGLTAVPDAAWEPASVRAWLLAGGVFAAVALVFLLAAAWGHCNVETTRRRLTGWAAALASTAALLMALGAVDTFARHLAFRSETGGALSSGLAVVLAVVAMALLQSTGGPASGRPSVLSRRWAAPTALVVGAGICMLLAALYAWAVYRTALAASPPLAGGPAAAVGVGARIAGLPHGFWLLGLLACSASLLHLLSPGFLNLSTIHHLYAARLTRSYLGAANLRRLSQQRDGVMDKDGWLRATHDDDLWTLRQYFGLDAEAPSLKPGDVPIHLANATLAERRGGTSDITQRDRRGLILSIGPAGMTVGTAHFPWRLPLHEGRTQPRRGSATELIDQASRLKLGNWMAVSGAAVSAGVGAQTRLGFALLAALFNVRLGYWWSAPPQLHAPHPSTAAERLRQALRALTHRCLFAEMTGGFWGRRSARWYLSDGGHFENTGTYELIRRRIPFIVVSDNGADPAYAFRDVGNLTRKVRVDLGAQIEVLGAEALKARLPVDLLPLFGAQADFQREERRAERRMPAALLALVRFDEEPDALPLTVLMIKPALIEGLPADLLHYAAARPRFPQEPTVDQFFDEAQWESYRRLGELIGQRLFVGTGGRAGAFAGAGALSGATASGTAQAWRPAAFMPLEPQGLRGR